MTWICPVCNLKLKRVVYPVYCMCGNVFQCEEQYKDQTKSSIEQPVKTDNFIDRIPDMAIPTTRNEQIKADNLIKELEKEGIQKHDLDKPPEGLGDTVERVLTKFGITKEFVKKFTGQKTCGCDKRKQWLNKLFPYVKE